MRARVTKKAVGQREHRREVSVEEELLVMTVTKLMSQT